ncbi:polyprenol phosphomannose-dependent alpha 1,6 mannosyltransferase MptB [Streptomyces coeruleorubidus]
MTVAAQRRPGAAVSMSGAGIALFGVVGVGAPNPNTLRTSITWLRLPALPGTVSEAITSVAIVLSCLGALGMLDAHRRGWSPDPRLLFRAGALAVLVVANLTPVGSSDTASYAAYGRIAALGGDPYVTTPAQLGGAYAHLVGDVWRNTPSVYGPVATWWQAAAAFVGGDQPWLTIWALMLANAAAFLATGYLLIRTADDPIRAGLLWIANPLLIGVLVAGGHLDTIVVCMAVCALHFVHRAVRWHHDLIAGGLVGLACGVKISAALLGMGLAWPLLRSGAWRQAALQVCAATLTLTVLYGAYGLHTLVPLSAASRMVSTPSLWAVFDHLGTAFLGHRAVATTTSILWPALMLALAWGLHRRVPADTPAVVAVSFVLAFAWILAAPWSMPWYTALACAMAALAGQGRLTQYLIGTTAVLALFHNSGGHGWTW